MFGENRQLVTDEPVSLRNNQLKSRLQENYRSFERNLLNIPQFRKGKPEDLIM